MDRYYTTMAPMHIDLPACAQYPPDLVLVKYKTRNFSQARAEKVALPQPQGGSM